MARKTQIILLGICILLIGCKIGEEQRDLSCQECGFNKSTDSILCSRWGVKITYIECDGNNYIFAFENTPSNMIFDKWGKYDKTEYLETEIITKCEKIYC